MDDSDEVISVWKNVSIEISDTYLAPGTLKLIRSGLSIVFYWVPQITSNSDLFDIDPGHISFVIELRQVDSISFDTSYISYGIIEFLFKDFTVFPRFFFNDYGSLAVSHLIHFLLDQKFVTISIHNESMVSISSNVSSLGYIPENIANSVRFKTLVEHWRALDLLGAHNVIESKNPVSEEETKKSTMTINIFRLGSNKNSENNIINAGMCFERGIIHKDRCKIWSRFLNANTKYHMEDQKNLTRYQQGEIASTINLINTDTDNLIKSGKHDDLFIHFLRDILCSIALFYPNSTFQRGISEVLTIFIEVFVKSFKEKKKTDTFNESNTKVIMNDGRTLKYNEARHYIFQLFITFIKINGLNYYMTQNDKFYRSFIDRINAIIDSVDPSVSSRLQIHQIKNLNFLSKSIYLLYARDFEREKVLRLWDSIIASYVEEKTFFILFFHAAMIILLFNPMFMMNKKNSEEEIAEEEMKKANLELVIRMADRLINIVKNKKYLEWVFQPLDDENDFIDYQPTYLTIMKE